MKKLLITAFTPMKPWRLNASEQVLLAAKQSIESETVATRVFAADTVTLAAQLQSALKEFEPDIVLHLGQAAKRDAICFERFATNLKDYQTADCNGIVCDNEEILTGGPLAYRSSLANQEQLVAHLRGLAIPAKMSNYAGNSLCNQLLYLSCDQTKDSAIAVTFIHLPILPQQKEGEWLDSPSLELERQVRALSEIIRLLQSDDTHLG